MFCESRPSIAWITSPSSKPAAAAGPSATTLETTARLIDSSCGMLNAIANSSTGRMRFATEPETSTMKRCQRGAAASERVSVGSSSPSSRTKPPNGSQFTVYSVSPQRLPAIRGGKPTPNSSTRMPNSFAVTKCASSCATTRKIRIAKNSSAALTASRAITNAATSAISTGAGQVEATHRRAASAALGLVWLLGLGLGPEARRSSHLRSHALVDEATAPGFRGDQVVQIRVGCCGVFL